MKPTGDPLVHAPQESDQGRSPFGTRSRSVPVLLYRDVLKVQFNTGLKATRLCVGAAVDAQ